MAGESGGECERVCENESNREKDRKREVGGTHKYIPSIGRSLCGIDNFTSSKSRLCVLVAVPDVSQQHRRDSQCQ